SYRELDSEHGAFIIPTTSPVDFDPDALHASIRRLVALKPAAVYLTHFGPVTDIERLGDDLHRMIDAMVDIADKHGDAADHRHQAIVDDLTRLYTAKAEDHG